MNHCELREWMRQRRERGDLSIRWMNMTMQMQKEIAVDRLLAELEGRPQLARYEEDDR